MSFVLLSDGTDLVLAAGVSFEDDLVLDVSMVGLDFVLDVFFLGEGDCKLPEDDESAIFYRSVVLVAKKMKCSFTRKFWSYEVAVTVLMFFLK